MRNLWPHCAQENLGVSRVEAGGWGVAATINGGALGE